MSTPTIADEPATGTAQLELGDEPLTDEQVAAALDAPPPAPVDPAAPKGYTRDGRPRKRAPKVPRKTASPAAPRPRPTSTRTSKEPEGPSARKGAETIVQLTAGGLLIMGSMQADEADKLPYQLDSMTLAVHGGALVDGLEELAAANDPTRKVLEWLGTVGPYAALIGAVTAIGAQVAVNHRKMPAHAMDELGIPTLEPAELGEQFARIMMGAR